MRAPCVKTFSLWDYGCYQMRAAFDRGEYADLAILVTRIDAHALKLKKVMTHRAVVAAWSPVLRELVDGAVANGQPSWIRLVDVPDFGALQLILAAFYTRRLVLSAGNVWETREVAAYLAVEPIVNICDMFLKRHASARNCVKWLQHAQKFGNRELEEDLQRIIIRSFNAIKDTEAFLRLDSVTLLALLESHELRCTAASELSVLKAAMRWVEHHAWRRHLLPNVLSRIRFNLLEEEDRSRLASGEHGFQALLGEEQRAVLAAKMEQALEGIPRRGAIRRGVQINTPLGDIVQGGWKLVYAQPYSARTLSGDLEGCKGDFLLVGACRKQELMLPVCAMGRRDSVLRVVGPQQITFENGVYWYNRPGAAFGFGTTPYIGAGGEGNNEGDQNKRLSWRLHQDEDGDGGEPGSDPALSPALESSRAGEAKDLDESTKWMKVIFSLCVRAL
ncbi:unnamed protein product [Ostreobium quekettii]|uniref:BTB domain-containing protein n=1 Tax=Ostreobium quekettii TaxID=121088 RepID=A0A8S1J8X3_9CHLO|nr:unnamed protein product [Ostreobium quekettii]|eukprot:evm.model.scf_1306.4 EVM.evm.TU.scf_1306.4   scf_1306:25331-28584(-)